MAKFADAFSQMGVPYPFKVATVNYDVQSQYGAQHVVKVLHQGVELDWWLKPERFTEMFPKGVNAGDEIEVTKNKSPNDPSRSYYSADVTNSSGVETPRPTQTATQPVPNTPSTPSFEQKQVEEKAMWERKDTRILISAYVKSLIERGEKDVENIKTVARDLAEWTNKTADELAATNLADHVEDVFGV